MRVEDIMTKDVLSCSQGTDVASAAEIMWKRDCGSLPVVEKGGRVIGMVTDRDLFIALGTSNRKPSELPVGEAMSKDVAVCSPGDDIGSVLRTMAQKQLHRLPVVGDAGVLKGIVTINDVALRAPGEVAVDVVNAMRGICERRDHREAAHTDSFVQQSAAA